MEINDDEIEAAGLNSDEVKKIAKGISRYAKQAAKLGITVFGGADGGYLYFNDGGAGSLVLAALDGDFNGGAGSADTHSDGLLRGEC